VEYIIGVDIGGTKIHAALADRHGTILAEIHDLTRATRGYRAIIDNIIEYIEKLRSYMPEGGSLLGIGIGCPGPLDPVAGVVITAPNLPGWIDIPLCQLLRERTGLPVRLANDANAAALGELYFGGGIGRSHMVYITISTGIGAGVIVDGHVLLGRSGAGGEVGHMLIDLQHRRSWEDLASGTALRTAASAAMQTEVPTMLHELATPHTVTAVEVALAAQRGDALAMELMQREAEFLGLGFVNVLHLFSPEIILVGGSVVTANPSLLDDARRVVQERVIADVYRSVPIEVAHLGNKVGVLGAVALLLVEES